ncbi:MAG: PD-(D/E)XK nuclease family protein [Patescibacteria group bacterium]
MRTSYSALGTFETCPLKYKYQEIEKRKTPKRAEQVFGTVVHSALKRMFERDPLYPTLEEVIDYYGRTWREAAGKVVWIKPEQREGEEEMYFAEGVKIITNFYRKNKPWSANAVELESRFSASIVDEQSGEKHVLSGIIDRLDKDPNENTYEIIDYKTGKRMPSADSLADNLQLGLYAIALRARWPHLQASEIKTSLYFLKHNDKVSIAHTDETLARAKTRILTLINEITRRMSTDDFQPTPGPLCNYCGFRSLCPMWSHEYKKVEAPAPDEKQVSLAISAMFEIKKEESELKKRAAAARSLILLYMEKVGVLRVFGSGGFITKQIQERSAFNMGQVRPILERLQKWETILSPDEKKLSKLLIDLSENDQNEILAARERKTITTLKVSPKKKIDEESDSDDSTSASA